MEGLLSLLFWSLMLAQKDGRMKIYTSFAMLRSEQARAIEDAGECAGVDKDDATLMCGPQHCWIQCRQVK